MKPIGNFFILLVWALGMGCGQETEPEIERGKSAVPAVDVASPPDLSAARQAWRDHNYAMAVDQYMARELDDQPALLLERGQVLLKTGDFYAVLGDFADRLYADLLDVWMGSGSYKDELFRIRGGRDPDSGRKRFDAVDSPSFSCLAAVDAYERGDYFRSVSLLAAVETGDALPELEKRARLAIAASYLRLGEADAGRKMLLALREETRDDPVWEIQILKRSIEVGDIDPRQSAVPKWTLPEKPMTGIENATLVDLAWIHLQRGEAIRALELLQRFDPRIPLAEEAFEFQVEAGEKLVRQFYTISFLPLAARVHRLIAVEDLRLAARAGGETGLYAQYLLGLTLLDIHRYAEAEKAFQLFLEQIKGQKGREEVQIPSGYLEHLEGLARIYAGRAIWNLGRKEEAELLWESVPEGNDLNSLALHAAAIFEKIGATGKMEELERLIPIYDQLMERASSVKTRMDIEYFKTAGIKAAISLRKSADEQHREKAIRLMEEISGYDPKSMAPRLRVEMAWTYYAFNRSSWSQGKYLITGLAVTSNRSCFPVSELYGYVLAPFGGIATGQTIPE